MERATALLEQMEEFQLWMAGHFGLDDEGVPFGEKKHKTSFMRRFAPEGVGDRPGVDGERRAPCATSSRTAPPPAPRRRSACILGKVGELMVKEAPALFGDYTVEDGAWLPGWRKV